MLRSLTFLPILALVLSLCSINGLGQSQSKIDSLHIILYQAASDTLKVSVLNQLYSLLKFKEPDKAVSFAKQAQQLADSINFPKGLAQAHYNLGFNDFIHGSYQDAHYKLTKALDIFKNINDSRGQADTYNMLGNVESNRNVKQSLEYYLQSRVINEELQDTEGLAHNYGNLATLYMNAGDNENALEYYLDCLKMLEKLNNERGMSIAHNNIGLLYHKIQKYDLALEYYRRGLALKNKVGDLFGKANTINNIGLTYASLDSLDLALHYYNQAVEINEANNFRKQLAMNLNNIGIIHHKRNNMDAALSYLLKSLKLKEEIGEVAGQSSSHLYLGALYVDQSKPQMAIGHLNKGLVLAREINKKDVVRDIYQELSEAYSLKGEYGKSLYYYQLYSDLYDSLLNEENLKQINYLEAKYQSEKKEQEITLLTKEKELQDEKLTNQALLRNILIGGIILIAVFSTFLIRGYRKRLNANRMLAEKDHELSNQRIRELEKIQKLNSMRAMVEGQEAERIRVAKDLHDSLGSLLSSVKMHFGELKPHNSKKQEFEKVNVLIDDACTELRSVAHNMMPDALLKFGLINALEDLAGKLGKEEKLDINVQSFGLNYRLDSDKEIAIYRIIQELLNNAVKHARATEVLIQLTMHDHKLNVLVEDNGTGFNTENIDLKKNGMGMKNMHSRISYLNGEITFDSVAGTGTTITMDIPLEP